MSLKAKLFSCIAAACLIVSMTIMGVLAADNANITLNGSLSFDAKDVVCRVEGSVSGAKETVIFDTLNYSSTTEPTEEELDSWNNNLNFQDNASDIVITVKVTNLAVRAMRLSVTDLIGDDSATSNVIRSITKQQTGDSAAVDYTSGSTITLAASQTDGDSSVTFTIRLKVDNKGLGASATYNYRVGLYDESVNSTQP